jgi:hypothetical protein
MAQRKKPNGANDLKLRLPTKEGLLLSIWGLDRFNLLHAPSGSIVADGFTRARDAVRRGGKTSIHFMAV